MVEAVVVDTVKDGRERDVCIDVVVVLHGDRIERPEKPRARDNVGDDNVALWIVGIGTVSRRTVVKVLD